MHPTETRDDSVLQEYEAKQTMLTFYQHVFIEPFTFYINPLMEAQIYSECIAPTLAVNAAIPLAQPSRHIN
jgi:hypothetical protein